MEKADDRVKGNTADIIQNLPEKHIPDAGDKRELILWLSGKAIGAEKTTVLPVVFLCSRNNSIEQTKVFRAVEK